MTARLEAYKLLERAAQELDKDDDPMEAPVRELMDQIWRGLSRKDREELDARGEL